MKYVAITTIGMSLFILTSCGTKKLPTSQGGFRYKGIYFGSFFTRHYKEGIQDGCNTAKGNYQKSHWLFKNSKDYHQGWFLGRNRCKVLLKLDKNGDLIL